MNNSKDDAITQGEFERMWETARDRGDELDQIIFVLAGHLGLRASEIANLKKSWIDFDQRVIQIPRKDGDFSAKTPASARRIYYDYFNPRVAETIESFFENHDAINRSRNTVYRKVKKLSRWAGLSKEVYPHALRATCAMQLAEAGLNAQGIRGIMGWEELNTAQVYIRKANIASKRQLQENQGKLW